MDIVWDDTPSATLEMMNKDNEKVRVDFEVLEIREIGTGGNVVLVFHLKDQKANSTTESN